MCPRWLRVDNDRRLMSHLFTAAMDRDGTRLLDAAGHAHQQSGNVERHGQWFESMLMAVLAEIQPSNRAEWLECVPQAQQATHSLLNVAGVSPCQIVFGRNPEVPEDLLQDSPDVVANSAVLHDATAEHASRIRAVARRQVLAYNDKRAVSAALDARPRVFRAYRPGEMVAVWRKVQQGGGSGLVNKRSYHRWRPGICVGAARGNYWVAVPGGSAEGVARTAQGSKL